MLTLVKIDSICIIQGNRRDWESEAPRMQSIYGNAVLVIAASLSPSPSHPIFTTRAPTAHFDFECKGKSSAATYPISVKERVEHESWLSRDRDDFRVMPLHGRAWAFQERLLARRMIHFSPTELVWECKTHARCECSGIEWPNEVGTAYNPGTSLKTEVAGALDVAEKAQYGVDAWHSIVSQYTARHLTVPNDRLPALSGLARLFAFPHAGRYLAGMWSAQLPDGLDWQIKDATKPDVYRAPSWCWASLDGRVDYTTHGGVTELKLIKAECTPAGEDAYGAVSGGYIIVKGEFGPTAIEDRRERDFDIPIDQREDVWALKLNMSDWKIWHSLLLIRSQRVKGAWQRVGLAIEGDKCFEGREKSTIKIV